jgi:hypothetical protein
MRPYMSVRPLLRGSYEADSVACDMTCYVYAELATSVLRDITRSYIDTVIQLSELETITVK